MADQSVPIVARCVRGHPPMEARTFLALHCIAVDSRGDRCVGEVAQTYRDMWREAPALQKFRRMR
ncbi:MAG: hypothetical protein AB7N65_20020 [Vicinamibacterales bacterium]